MSVGFDKAPSFLFCFEKAATSQSKKYMRR